MKLDNRMKQLLREMGEAINDSLSASDELTETIDKIRKEGFDIFLILEATIGLNPKSGEKGEQSTSRLPASIIEISEAPAGETAALPMETGGGGEMVFQVSPDDEQFLRSLRISVEDSGSGPDDSDPKDQEGTDDTGSNNKGDGHDG